MEPLTLSISLGLFAAGSGLGWWISRNETKLDALKSQMVLMQESQASSMAISSKRIEDLKSSIMQLVAGIGAIRAAHPSLDGLIKAHEALQGKGDLIDALETLVLEIPIEADHTHLSQLDAGTVRLAESLLEAITDVGALSAPLARKIGLVALASGRINRAKKLLETSYELTPGNESTLRILEHIALLETDTDSRRQWIEARLELDPDNAELLRNHAHLLVSIGDSLAEKDVLRLEALGLDTPADRSLLSGLRARAGSKDEALEAIERALEEDPNRSEDWFNKAKLLFDMGELNKALEATDSCIELDRQHGQAWALRAKLLAHSPRLEEAAKAATHAVALAAGGVELIMLKADLFLALGDEEKSEETLQKALDEYAQNGEILAAIAGHRLLENRYTEAWDILHNAPPSVNHVNMHVIEGRLHLAIADRQRDGTDLTDASLLSLAKNSFNAALDIDRENGLAWLGLARTQRLLADISSSTESLTRASRLMGDEEPSVSTESALLALESGDLELAQQHIDAASIRGGGPIVSYIRGNISAHLGDLKLAKIYYNEALEQDPTHVRSRLNRCSVYMAIGEGQAALDDSNILLEIAPKSMLARLKRAEANMMMGFWQEARTDLEMIISQSPHHHHALTQLAACHIALGHPEQAESPLNEALRLDSNYAAAWYQRGLLYLDWEKEEAAISDFEAAIRSDSKHLDAHLHLAAIHHKSSRHKKAIDAWKAVLSIDPEHKVAKKRLEESEQILLEK